MKPKNFFRIMALMTSVLIFATSQGADEFYYGGFHVQNLFDTPDTYRRCRELRDSLRFNMVLGSHLHEYVDSLASASLQGIPEQGDTNSPTYWSRNSHYTLWEAEGFPGSNVNLHYNGGTLVNDPSASGGKAMYFVGPGVPDTIQTGPAYYQEPKDGLGQPIQYIAEFRLKFWYYLGTPLGPMAPGPPPNSKVCCIMVVDTYHDTILKADTLYKSEFPGGGGGPYQTFELENYTVPEDNLIEFQIYWFAPPEAWQFYIDYVKAHDNYGEQLMSGLRDAAIMDYVSQDWVTTLNAEGDTVVYRWYMKDQPHSIDYYMPYAHIDNLLRAVSQEKIVNQILNRIWKPEKIFCNKRK